MERDLGGHKDAELRSRQADWRAEVRMIAGLYKQDHRVYRSYIRANTVLDGWFLWSGTQFQEPLSLVRVIVVNTCYVKPVEAQMHTRGFCTLTLTLTYGGSKKQNSLESTTASLLWPVNF